MRTTDPATELRKALQKYDLRFLGVARYSLMVPGVPGEGTINPIVAIRGVRLINGTTDYSRSAEQGRLQPIAFKYAGRYNRLLFAHLLRVNDPAVGQSRRKIDRELSRLERSDPIRDAKQVLKEAPPMFLIELPDGTDTIPGIDRKALEASQHADNVGGVFGYSLEMFVLVAEIMTPFQRSRLALQVSR